MVGSYTEALGKSKGCEVKLSFVIPVGQNTFSCKSGWFTQSWFEGERIASLNKIDSAEVCSRSWGFGVCWYISFENLQDLVVLQTCSLSWKLKF